jgi:uncharacterized protein (TIGR02246 family)
MQKLKFSLTCVVAVVLVGCAQAPPQADTRAADEKAIRDDAPVLARDWSAKDADKIAAHYADDAVVMSPGFPPAPKAAIRDMVGQLQKDPNMSMKVETSFVEVAKSGDIAYSRGTYEMTATDPQTKQPVLIKGTYVTTFRKAADGSWKAVADINTPSGPPMPATHN